MNCYQRNDKAVPFYANLFREISYIMKFCVQSIEIKSDYVHFYNKSLFRKFSAAFVQVAMGGFVILLQIYFIYDTFFLTIL